MFSSSLAIKIFCQAEHRLRSLAAAHFVLYYMKSQSRALVLMCGFGNDLFMLIKC